MNVFRKISSSTTSIFHTQKKQPIKSRIPQSAQKLATRQQECFYLLDYDIRGEDLIICKLTKDKNLIKKIGWRKLGSQIIQCTVKNRSLHEMWIGKQYWFVNMEKLGMDQGELENNDSLPGRKFVSEKAVLINQGRNAQKCQRK